jgi:hypothetical protein
VLPEGLEPSRPQWTPDSESGASTKIPPWKRVAVSPTAGVPGSYITDFACDLAVLLVGLEPTLREELDFESRVSANSTTGAK